MTGTTRCSSSASDTSAAPGLLSSASEQQTIKLKATVQAHYAKLQCTANQLLYCESQAELQAAGYTCVIVHKAGIQGAKVVILRSSPSALAANVDDVSAVSNHS
jgi:hypothetical protein